MVELFIVIAAAGVVILVCIILGMALGRADDYRYRQVVPPEVRAMAEAAGWGKPNWYVPSGEGWPYYPPSVIEFLEYVERQTEAGTGEAEDG